MRLPVFALLLCSAVVSIPWSSPVAAGAQAAMPEAPKKPLSPPAVADAILPSATIAIHYAAPSMRGRAIFGGLVPYDVVWRTGANAATALKTSGNLKIGGLAVPAGAYTLYTLPTASGWKLIVNKQTGQWGTVYDEKQDLGRVDMKVGSNPAPIETMVIGFEKTMGDSTELHVKWAGVDAFVPVTAGK